MGVGGWWFLFFVQILWAEGHEISKYLVANELEQLKSWYHFQTSYAIWQLHYFQFGTQLEDGAP